MSAGSTIDISPTKHLVYMLLAAVAGGAGLHC